MPDDLTLHENGGPAGQLLVVGEVLWDVFPDTRRLGGAPLNFAVHARRLGFHATLVSALGKDELGKKAAGEMEALGLDLGMTRWSNRWATGTASVSLDCEGRPAFQISRPAAYDDLCLLPGDLQAIQRLSPNWVYFGTLFPSIPEGRATLEQLLDAAPQAIRLYDVNLRPGFDSMQLVVDLLGKADVVKLNECEAQTVAGSLGLAAEAERFCRAGAERYGWRAVCITLGERGCAIFDGRDFVEARGENVQVVDTVGAGDAFAAAFLYGLSNGWTVSQIAGFANRVGGLVASRAGAIPEWSILEAVIT